MGVPPLGKNPKNGVFDHLVLLQNLKYTLYLIYMACSIFYKNITLPQPYKRGPTPREKSEKRSFRQLNIIPKNLEFTIYLIYMACSISHKEITLLWPSRRGPTPREKSEKRSFRQLNIIRKIWNTVYIGSTWHVPYLKKKLRS